MCCSALLQQMTMCEVVHTCPFAAEVRDGTISSMTRGEAIAEARRQQDTHPEAKWIATERDGEWVVARIGLEPATGPTGTAIKPPPSPEDAPQSELQRVVTQFGAGG
jgi:hypothetical protein